MELQDLDADRRLWICDVLPDDETTNPLMLPTTETSEESLFSYWTGVCVSVEQMAVFTT